ncbi:uncharacterized protein LOC125229295 isoform X2 [Leguminivora glycinivorella]|uniref:uncharacterized protein LOC125229295 isoform X2 n=1 Tax=Leguminivora glycinivorella TaxID=1035111 RepID=UPI00200FA381|nr:uncharacterized protein LOC125229295 isoform X2 [Leguminivora glycinivorella]
MKIPTVATVERRPAILPFVHGPTPRHTGASPSYYKAMTRTQTLKQPWSWIQDNSRTASRTLHVRRGRVSYNVCKLLTRQRDHPTGPLPQAARTETLPIWP